MCRHVLALMLVALVLVPILGACERKEADPYTEAPKIPAPPVGGTLEPPPRLQPAPKQGTATVPRGSTLAFALDVDGVVVRGDWRESGQVTRVQPNLVTFQNAAGKPVRFVYRLPQGLRLRVAVGDAITLDRKTSVVGGGIAYELTLKTSDVALAVGTCGGKKPRTLPHDGLDFPAGLRLEQQAPGPKQREGAAETERAVPVKLRHGDVVTTLRRGIVAEATVSAGRYGVLIRQSRHIESKRPGESSGYFLEYVIVRR